MIRLLFVASQSSTELLFESMDSLMELSEGFFSVALSNEQERLALFQLLDIEGAKILDLPDHTEFLKMYDFSSSRLPVLSVDEFDELYGRWIKCTGRESNMDEYGQLTFVQGQAEHWNSLPTKLVMIEKP